VAVYDAAVRRIMDELDRPRADIAILNRPCATAAEADPPFGCKGLAWRPGVRAALEDRLADLGSIDWVDTRADVPAFGHPQARTNAVLIVLGPVRASAGELTLGWAAYTLPMGGQGETDRWTCPEDRCIFDGPADGGAWIS
jgi:hypothetical protein